MVNKNFLYAGAAAGAMIWALFTVVSMLVLLFVHVTGVEYVGEAVNYREFLLYLGGGVVFGGLYDFLPGKRSTSRGIGFVFMFFLIFMIFAIPSVEFIRKGVNFLLLMLMGGILSSVFVGLILGFLFDFVMVKMSWYPDSYQRSLVTSPSRIDLGSGFKRIARVIFCLLTLATLGDYLYLLRNPWNMVPYSIISLGIVWWLFITMRFKSTQEVGEIYYVPPLLLLSIYMTFVPSMSIILRGYMELTQALNMTFLSLAGFVLITYGYYHLLQWRLK